MTEQDTPLRLLEHVRQMYPHWGRFIADQKENFQTVSDAALFFLVCRCGIDVAVAPLAAGKLAAAYLWDSCKKIYAFDEDLAQVLRDQAAEAVNSGAVPVETLRAFPAPCAYIKAADVIEAGLDGFFVWREDRAGKGYLQIAFLNSQMSFVTAAAMEIDPDGGLEASLPDPDAWLYPYIVAAARHDEDALQTVLHYRDMGGPAAYRIHNWLLRALQMILYLCCDNADIRKEHDVSPEGTENGADSGPVEKITVGTLVGSEIRKAARDNPEGKARKAHTRKGHWHSYWTGPKNGERKRITRWVAPVFVGSRIKDVDIIAVEGQL